MPLRDDRRPPVGRLEILSRHAISYAVELVGTGGAPDLWKQLYNFNSYPDPTLADLSICDESGESFAKPLLDKAGPEWVWTQRSDPHWIFFSRPGRDEAAHTARCKNGHFKIYVSPAAGAFRHAVEATLRTSVDYATLKFARKHNGTLRSDKIVIFTNSMAHTRRVADAVLSAIGEVPAHGVPFTADLGGDGLLSWATDPVSSELRQFRSWRVWVCHMLVSCINAAPTGADPDVQVDAVLEALATQHGVVSGAWKLTNVRRKGF
jgi:hypothetical protein